MSEQQSPQPGASAGAPQQRPEDAAEQQVIVIGPDGQPLGAMPMSALRQAEDAPAEGGQGEEGQDRPITELVEQPAKVMRIGTMIRQLLEEVKAAPLDEPSRNRLREIHHTSIRELEEGLAPELVEELNRLAQPFAEDQTPSEGELRIAQAQLVGWLEGLFQGLQTAIYAQQMAARAQIEQIRRGLPPGSLPAGIGVQQPGAPGRNPNEDPGSQAHGGGMYL